MSKKFVVVVIFGEQAAKTYCEEGLNAAKDCILNGDGTVMKREFDTEAERNAYMEGCRDADGWWSNTIIDDDDVKKHPNIIKSML